MHSHTMGEGNHEDFHSNLIRVMEISQPLGQIVSRDAMYLSIRVGRLSSRLFGIGFVDYFHKTVKTN